MSFLCSFGSSTASWSCDFWSLTAVLLFKMRLMFGLVLLKLTWLCDNAVLRFCSSLKLIGPMIWGPLGDTELVTFPNWRTFPPTVTWLLVTCGDFLPWSRDTSQCVNTPVWFASRYLGMYPVLSHDNGWFSWKCSMLLSLLHLLLLIFGCCWGILSIFMVTCDWSINVCWRISLRVEANPIKLSLEFL